MKPSLETGGATVWWTGALSESVRKVATNMLKMYNRESSTGAGTGDFWDHTWAKNGLEQLLLGCDRTCEGQPIYPLLQETARPGRLFLEGGCGPGYWVKYFHKRGYRTLGIDFASRTIEALHALDPGLPVEEGDITALPLGDGSVHTYYSGGVVEHFESGPEAALAEARRVLAADGTFLCSVPDETLLRDVLYGVKDSGGFATIGPHAARSVERTLNEATPPGCSFFQYIFREEEFVARLRTAGFRVSRTFPFAFVCGLYAVPGFEAAYGVAVSAGRAIRNLTRQARPRVSANVVEQSADPTTEASLQAPRAGLGLLTRLLVHEDPSIPVLGPLLQILGKLTANMRMYVAHPR